MRRHEVNEGFLVTGFLIPLTLPATIPLWQVAMGTAFGIVFGVWFLVDDTVNVLVVIIVAFLLSGVASLVFLDQQRNAFAQRVERRAGRISEKYDEMRAKEDQD